MADDQSLAPIACLSKAGLPEAPALKASETPEPPHLPPDQSGSNQVDLYLNTQLLNVHLQARPSNDRIIELTTQAEMLRALFHEANLKLEFSLQKIGYLEARLEEAQAQLAIHASTINPERI